MKKTKTFKRLAGYGAFTFFSLILCVYLQFPHEMVQEQVLYQIQKGLKGMALIEIGRTEFTGPLSVGADDVHIDFVQVEPAFSVQVERLELGVGFWSLLTAKPEVRGRVVSSLGRADFQVRPQPRNRVGLVAQVERLALTDPALLDRLPVAIGGTADLDLDLSLGRRLKHVQGDAKVVFRDIGIAPAEKVMGYELKQGFNTGVVEMDLRLEKSEFEVLSFKQFTNNPVPSVLLEVVHGSGTLADNPANATFSACAKFKLSDGFANHPDNVDLKRASMLLELQLKRDQDDFYHLPVQGNFGFRRLPKLKKALCPKKKTST